MIHGSIRIRFVRGPVVKRNTDTRKKRSVSNGDTDDTYYMENGDDYVTVGLATTTSDRADRYGLYADRDFAFFTIPPRQTRSPHSFGKKTIFYHIETAVSISYWTQTEQEGFILKSKKFY